MQVIHMQLELAEAVARLELEETMEDRVLLASSLLKSSTIENGSN
jgi:hypothetical protein